MSNVTGDIRDSIFESISGKSVRAAITVTHEGIICGVNRACELAENLGIGAMANVTDGMFVHPGDAVMLVTGSPKDIALAEDSLIGAMSKVSGIATAARAAVDSAAGRVSIVSGSMKKLPAELKDQIRHAVVTGGAAPRIADVPFVYLDKNYIRMFGGVARTLQATASFDCVRAVQLRGELEPIEAEARAAVSGGAGILMIDTGSRSDISRVLGVLYADGTRGRVKVAFSGNINLSDISDLSSSGVDILCIGHDIADAPLLDMKLDVISVEDARLREDIPLNLLEKTELWIENIRIQNVDLNRVAETAADVLGFDRSEVLVVDVRESHITLDILRRTVDGKAVFGKQDELLRKLGEIPGFGLTDDSFIHSDGILGLIAMDPSFADDVLEQTVATTGRIMERISKRALIFPTGFELERGMIRDTNSVFLCESLTAMGYDAKIADPIEDKRESITCAIVNGAYDGYSLIFTTGGVGAEDKDFTVEAVLEVDPDAVTPWIAKYRKGHGRHVKDGVRIAVGQFEGSTIISLPGPNDEVRLAFEAIKDVLATHDKYIIAQRIAKVLRNKLANIQH